MDFKFYLFVLCTLALLKITTAQFSEETFYKTCTTTKVLCFGLSVADMFDEQCISNKKCDLAVSAFEDPKYPGKVRFQLMGKPPSPPDVNFVGSYIAVGLSQDVLMGDDSVVECVSNKKTTIYTSWNTLYQNKRLSDKSYISNGWVSSKDRTLFCDFTRNVKSTVENAPFDLERDVGFHVMLAMGNLATYPEDRITHHTARKVSGDPILNRKSIVRHQPPTYSDGEIQRTSWTFLSSTVLLALINQLI